jgi:hypothetical protein
MSLGIVAIAAGACWMNRRCRASLS